MKKVILILISVFSISFSAESSQEIQENLDKVRPYLEISIDSSFYFAKQAYDLSDNLNNDSLKSTSCLYLGNLYRMIGEIDSALKYDLIGLNIEQNQMDSLGISDFLQHIGIDYSIKNDFRNALKYQLENYDLSKKFGSAISVYEALSNLIITRKILLQSDEAFDEINKLLELSSKLDSTKTLLALDLYCGLLIDLDSNLKAEKVYRKILKSDKFDSLENYRSKNILTNYASVLNSLKKAKLGLNYNKKADSIRLYYDDIELKTVIQRNFATSWLLLSDPDSSLKYAQKALIFAKKLDSYENYKYSYLLLSRAFKLNGKADSALHYFELYHNYSDSILNEKSTKIYKNLETKYKVKEKEAQIEFLEKENQYTNRINLLLTAGIVFFLLTILLLVLRYYDSKKKSKEMLEKNNEIHQKQLQINRQEHKLEIYRKEKSLAAQSKRLEENQDIIKRLKEKIKELELDSIKAKSLSDMIEELSLKENPEMSTKNFEYKFIEMYPDFYENLKSQSSDFTTAELRVASFLKLNMTTKEIANILNLSLSTINQHRYRIRQKLNLDSETSLNDYLTKM